MVRFSLELHHTKLKAYMKCRENNHKFSLFRKLHYDGFGRLCITTPQKDFHFKVQTEDYRVQGIYILPWETVNKFQLF